MRTPQKEAAIAAAQLTLRYATAAQTLPSADKRVLVAARRVFATWEVVVQWLTAPAPALGGQVPLEVADKGPAGVQEVLGVLNGIAHGHVQ